MAEIELGTIGSPEITLILNGSNNLEFQDTDGNVIATFKQDQSVEFSTVSTDALSSGTASDDTTDSYHDIATTFGVLDRRSQPTPNVGTSGTVILTASDSANLVKLTVFGIESSDYFADEVVYSFDRDPDVTTLHERNSPATRSYTTVNNTDVELAMGSGSYNVQVEGVMFEQ